MSKYEGPDPPSGYAPGIFDVVKAKTTTDQEWLDGFHLYCFQLRIIRSWEETLLAWILNRT